MNKFLLIIMLLMPMLVSAQYIDEKRAREIAASALKENVRNARAVDNQGRSPVNEPYLELHRVVKNDEGDLPCFYIYNQKGESGGFAIVSNQGQLLGYSECGTMDYDSVPDNLKWLLGQYKRILSVRHRDDGDDEGPDNVEYCPSEYRHSIKPLIGSEWHQHSPFNDLIKEKYLASGATYEKKIVAGCSTIAMAQIMFKWKYPERGSGSKEWKLGNATYIVHFDDIIDWDHIGPKPNRSPSTDDALSDLCYRVAASIDAIVTDGATGASHFGIVEGLTTYFNYDKSIRHEFGNYMEPDEFEDLAYAELEQGRPCILSGEDINDPESGHDMVIEGYDKKKGLFFLNMGWRNANSNAYYTLTVKDGRRNLDYVVSQKLITHIMPNQHGRPFPHVIAHRYSSARTANQARPRRAVNYDKNEGQKTYHVSAQIFSNDMDANIVTGIIAKDYVTGKECVFEGPTLNLIQGYLQNMSFDIDLSKIEYNGYYKLRPVFRMVDDDEWFTIEIPSENEGDKVERTCVDVSNANALDFGMEIDFALGQTIIATGTSAQVEYGLPIKGVPVTFTSSDPSIASVDEKGKITAHKSGEVSITAHCDDYYFNGNRLVKETTRELYLEVSDYKLNDVIVEEIDGVEMGFIVTSLSPKEVQFGGSACQALKLGSGVNSETTSGKVRIPSEVRGFRVTRIANGAFFWCEKVTEIEIPETIKLIEANAFYCCFELQSLHIPASVEKIEGTRTFWNVPSIESITVADGNRYYSCPQGSNCLIENATGTLLLGCKNSVIPNSVKIIGPASFSHQNIDTIDIPEGVITIGDVAFYGAKIHSIRLPQSLTTIEDDAFAGNWYLREIDLSSSLEHIGSFAFHNCISLRSITIPASVKSIGDYAFLYCPLTKVISISTEPTEIHDEAFAQLHEEGDEYVQDLSLQENTTLYVPAGCKSKYEAMEGWKSFKNIVEMIDVSHLVNVVNIIMVGSATDADMALYDINKDGELNIGDVILIAKNILGYSGSLQNTISNNARLTDFSRYTATQFELKTGKNTTIQDIRLVGSMEHSHQLMSRKIDADTYAVVIYSLSNQLLKPDNGNMIVVETSGGAVETMTIKNITAATPTGETDRFQGLQVATGIQQIERSKSPKAVYDLNGHRLNENQGEKKGIYIINGEKTVLK